MRAVFEDVNDQLAVVGVGQTQQVAAVGCVLADLVGVQLLLRHPARALDAEAQACPAQFAAGKNAVAGAKAGDELGVAHFKRRLLQRQHLGDGVQREVAQLLAEMAPSIQVPVVAVMHQSQGRDVALGGIAVAVAFAVAACGVGNVQPFALGQRGGDLFKMSGAYAALGQTDDAHTLRQFGGLRVAF